jgi:hypothetical protein
LLAKRLEFQSDSRSKISLFAKSLFFGLEPNVL